MSRLLTYDCKMLTTTIASMLLFFNILSSQNFIKKIELVNKKIVTSHFESIHANGDLNIILFEDIEDYVILETSKNNLKNINVMIDEDSCLNISSNRSYNEYNRPTIYVHFTKLDEIISEGNNNISCYTNFETEYLDISTDYDSNIELFISSFNLYANIDGYGKVDIAGEIDTVYIKSHNEVELNFSLRTKDITVEVNDLSSISLTGTTDQMQVIVNNEGYFKALDLISRIAKVNIQDFGEAQIYTTEKAEISAKEHASVIIKGNPAEIIENKSKNAIVRK